MTETTEDRGTLYHASVEDYRRCLASAYVRWHKDREKYQKLVYAGRDDGRKPTDAERDAYAASLMASGYSYTLAAIIKLAEERFGPDAALVLANKADDLLMNGDDGREWNADVMPAEGWVCDC